MSYDVSGRAKNVMLKLRAGICPPLEYFTDRSGVVLLLWIICVFLVLCFLCFCVCSLMLCGHLLGADLLACFFVTFPCGVLGQVWCSIVSFPDLSRLSYFICLKIWLRFIIYCLLQSYSDKQSS